MDVFKKNKKTKIILILTLIIISFSFMFPKSVHADWLIDWDHVGRVLAAAPAKIFKDIISGIYETINNLFVSDANKADLDQTDKPIYLTPENIIKGKFLLFDADIFKDVSSVTAGEYYDADGSGTGAVATEVVNGRVELRTIIARWYYGLRNFAVVSLLVVLVYVAIRMIISTISRNH